MTLAILIGTLLLFLVLGVPVGAAMIVSGVLSILAGGLPINIAAATALAAAMDMEADFSELGPLYMGMGSRVETSSRTDGSIRRRVDQALSRASALLLDHVEELDRAAAHASQLSGSPRPHLRLVRSEP